MKEKYNLSGPELDDDKVRLQHKIKDLTLDQIKAKIPRVVFSGILLSADILYNDHLRGSDTKKKREAAAVFLEKLGNANLLKNLAVLSSSEDDKNKRQPKKVRWIDDEEKG